MPDMLVKLYELPPLAPILQALIDEDIVIRPAKAPEKHVVLPWIQEHFSDAWTSEAEVAFSRQPISCLLAVAEEIPGSVPGFYGGMLRRPVGTEEQ